MEPSKTLLQLIEKKFGSEPVFWRSINRGYSGVGRYVMNLKNEFSIFVKVATNEQSAQWLKNEHYVYSNLQRDFMPKFFGWIDELEYPALILEDLSSGDWPPPWSGEKIAKVMDMLKEVEATKPPPNLPPLSALRSVFINWQNIKNEPATFLALEICSSRWLEEIAPALIKAEQSAVVDGESLVHFEVRSDNMCFMNGKPLLIDWNWACRGTPKADLICWLPSLHSEGGPPPWEITNSEPELISALAGYFAFKASQPPIDQSLEIRALQLKQLRVALPWACKALNLPLPDLI